MMIGVQILDNSRFFLICLVIHVDKVDIFPTFPTVFSLLIKAIFVNDQLTPTPSTQPLALANFG